MKHVYVTAIFILAILLSVFQAPAQWVQASPALTGNVSAFLVLGQDILAGTNGNSSSGAWRSTDNGTTWPETDPSIGGGTGVSAFAANATHIFAGTQIGVYATSDTGTHWSFSMKGSMADKSTSSLAVIDTNLFAGVYVGVFRSGDNGATWTETDSGITNKDITALVASGTSLLAGTFGGGAFLSTNYGKSWTAVDSGLTNQFVSAFAVNGTNIYAITGNGTYGSLVFLSTNNGTSWTSVSTGLPKSYTVSSLAISGTNLFAGANGVYVLRNNTGSWTSVSTGLPYGSVGALTVFGSYLYAGRGSNVYRRPLSELNSVADRQEAAPSHFELSQNYPNPFNPSTSIRYQIPSASHVTLKLFDELGREVATLVNDAKQPGTYTVRWDASTMASGTYFYRIEAGSFVQTRKLLVIK
ncbi:MAG TPA: T9SS type A sorting domain-containing protein [Bacteroidota bacterium]|nr:T9SS type A sorting domain-containing protein [Bacteroidota bacterium]